MSLLALVKSTRQQKGLTQMQVASEAKVSLATLQNLEAGRANPELHTLETILKVLGLDLVVHPKKPDWNILIHHGLPLLTENSLPVRAHVDSLIEELRRLSLHLPRLRKRGREADALIALIWGVHDHYPSLWDQLDEDLKTWWSKQRREGRHLKLRRISLAKLGAYL